MEILIEHIMNVIHGDLILVPGCEPISTVTSTTLEAELREKEICSGSVVALQDVLDAIPGTRVVIGMNWGNLSVQKFLVFPSVDQRLCCQGVIAETDIYAILRSLPQVVGADEVQEIIGKGCDSFKATCDSSLFQPIGAEPQPPNESVPPASQSL